MALAVVIDRLSYAYPDGQVALRDISMTIPAGEVLGVLGANGAGKSTLLLHLNGLVRGTGSLQIGDIPLNDRTQASIRRQVGLLFQNPDDQLFMPTIYDDVAFGPRNQGVPEEEVRRRVEQALDIVAMRGTETRPPHHLSLGQKKRVALATVLAGNCEVLALDEPTSGLDPRGRRELGRFLAGLSPTRIIATHDLEFAAELCHRVAVLHEGRLVALGPPQEVLADTELMENTGLEVPHSLRYHAPGIPHQHVASHGHPHPPHTSSP